MGNSLNQNATHFPGLIYLSTFWHHASVSLFSFLKGENTQNGSTFYISSQLELLNLKINYLNKNKCGEFRYDFLFIRVVYETILAEK